MTQKVILLSGASGFLGSHLAKDLSKSGFKILAIIRHNSDLSKFNGYNSDNLNFIRSDSPDFERVAELHSPKILIHSAWSGVSVHGRNNLNIQLENIEYCVNLLNLASKLKIEKVITFGSQAEYGDFSGRINESTICNPVSAYGAVKLSLLTIFRFYCEANSMQWFWLRLFSTYGTHEGGSWLIPSLISNILNGKAMDLTGCEQRYDYLFTRDLSNAVEKVITNQGESGIYNLSSNTSIRLRDLIEKIRSHINADSILNFGALPYRPNQVMHMEGDSTKFNKMFNFKVESNLDENLITIVNYYKQLSS